MNIDELRDALTERCSGFNEQLIAINDELAALNARSRELENVLLQTMGRKKEAAFLLQSIENSREQGGGDHGSNGAD
jgi:hypothetical protein